MVPLTIYEASITERGRRSQLTELVKGSFGWEIGYLGMWFGKWAIATLLTSVNVFDDAAAGIEMRSSMVGGYGESINPGGIFVRNIGGFILNPLSVFLIIYTIYCLRKDYKLKDGSVFQHINADICFVIIFLTPFIWYCVASNHAYTHVTTECKTLMISCLTFLYLITPDKTCGQHRCRSL
jgi:hypothetical protein